MLTMPAVAMLFGVASLIKLLVLAPCLYRSTDFEVCKTYDTVGWAGMDHYRGGEHFGFGSVWHPPPQRKTRDRASVQQQYFSKTLAVIEERPLVHSFKKKC